MLKPPARKWDHLIISAHLATMTGPGIGAVEDAAIALANGRIAWLGPVGELPDAPQACAEKVTSANRQWITPGFIDCHTHLMFAGHRADEFEQRLEGRSYQEIAAAGGGIHATVRATRAASESALIDLTGRRLRHLLAEGVSTVEIKSGYGLEAETELRMLRALQRLDDRSPMRVVATFLGAHAPPADPGIGAAAYIDAVVDEMLPAVVQDELATAVDAVLDAGLGFERPQVERVLERARAAGLDVRLHADQFSDGDGARVAARFGARCADHLGYASEEGIAAMADAGTVAVLLPGSFYALQQTRRPPVAALRTAGVPIAVATNANPGSSPLSSLITTMNMACVLFGLTPTEVLRGVTINAAAALGREAELGSLEVGKAADLAFWEVDHPNTLCYWLGGRRCRRVFVAGEEVF